MNTSDFIYLINKPNAIKERHGLILDKIVLEFPYFQSARALQLKNFYNQESFQYNTALKQTAAYTADRSVLFEFITSAHFHSLQQAFFDEKEAKINQIIVNGPEIIREVQTHKNVADKSLEQTTLEVKPIENQLFESIKKVIPTTLEEKLELGKPLLFSKSEKHSFQEWLQLAAFTPIIRTQTSEKETVLEEIITEKQKKLDLIDTFIKNNPKIPPVNKEATIAVVFEQNALDNATLMTETLAKVYLEQKKYHKAIQAYEILILKYPEKISFFANRISDIKILQQNNN